MQTRLHKRRRPQHITDRSTRRHGLKTATALSQEPQTISTALMQKVEWVITIVLQIPKHHQTSGGPTGITITELKVEYKVLSLDIKANEWSIHGSTVQK